MQPPSTSSRPNSTHQQMYQQQSPSHHSNNNLHMSPTSQAQSPSGNNNAQHYHQQQTSDGQQDWNQNNSWSDNHSNESFNPSDRININTRLKTMILNNKSDKEQQQSANHFLSYSHQHLPEQQHQLTNVNDLNTENAPKASNSNESRDVGGSELNDSSWKSSIVKQDKDHEEGRRKDFVNQKQSTENTFVDPGGGGKDEGCSKKSADRETTDLNPNEQESSKNFGASCEQSLMQLPGAEPSETKGGVGEREKQSYSYHSAHEYQQHKNMVNNIKKEPFEETTAGSVKYEGYEKNYQNFIRYADFCDAQQPQNYDQKQAPFQQEFLQPPGYYNNYPYQNYPASQNYSQQQSYQQFLSQQQAAYQHPNSHQSSSLTNFEQQIPLHTYPIPKHTPSPLSETGFQPANIKVEPMANCQPLPGHISNDNSSITKEEVGGYLRDSMNDLEDPGHHPHSKEKVRTRTNNSAASVSISIYYSQHQKSSLKKKQHPSQRESTPKPKATRDPVEARSKR